MTTVQTDAVGQEFMDTNNIHVIATTDLTLQPGTYARGSYYISIHQYGDRLCYLGGSIDAVTTASLIENPDQPGTYLINRFDTGATLSQATADTLVFAGGDFEKIGEANSLEQLGPELQACLTSAEPYFEQETFDN